MDKNRIQRIIMSGILDLVCDYVGYKGSIDPPSESRHVKRYAEMMILLEMVAEPIADQIYEEGRKEGIWNERAK